MLGICFANSVTCQENAFGVFRRITRKRKASATENSNGNFPSISGKLRSFPEDGGKEKEGQLLCNCQFLSSVISEKIFCPEVVREFKSHPPHLHDATEKCKALFLATQEMLCVSVGANVSERMKILGICNSKFRSIYKFAKQICSRLL